MTMFNMKNSLHWNLVLEQRGSGAADEQTFLEHFPVTPVDVVLVGLLLGHIIPKHRVCSCPSRNVMMVLLRQQGHK